MKSNPELTPVVGAASLDDRWPNWSAAAANRITTSVCHITDMQHLEIGQ
jgi:hypothetical protein